VIESPARVHVNFNDLRPDGCIWTTQEHAERTLQIGDAVLMLDCEGNSAWGRVTGMGTSRGVTVTMDAGTWHSLKGCPAPRILGWACEHMTVTMPAYAAAGVPTFGCGCEMRPFASNAA
jgi:hypothetical protein